MNANTVEHLGRRGFLGAAGLTILDSRLVRGSQANSAIRIGLLGCGGRGTADATSMEQNAGAKVVALADLFEDQVERAKKNFPGVASTMTFQGPKAYERLLALKDVDAVVIATPPYFHTYHLAAVVKAGKHVYCEKPVAVDVAGTRRVLDIGKQAEGKVSLNVGFQIRKAPPFVELVKRIHEGALGEISFGETYYLCPFLDRPPLPPNLSPAEARVRNWIYDRVLSGDIIVEQNIHVIDIMNWVMQAHPVKALAVAGRKGRPDSGDCNGHYSVTFWYPNDVHVNFSSKQFGKGSFDANERFFGTTGSSESPYSGTLGITGDSPWTWNSGEKQKTGEFSASGTFSDNLGQADAMKHKAFIESITSGKFLNEAPLGVESALSAMLGRMSAEKGRAVTWDEMMKSNESLSVGPEVMKLL